MKLTPTITLVLIAIAVPCGAQQTGDRSFDPVVATPAYETGKGPVVRIDEGHNNFHTAEGRYFAFAELLRRDGYVVEPHKGDLAGGSLKDVEILVISNALHERNLEDWSLPTPSAFTTEEVKVVSEWVRGGGALFLIADHMPMPGAAADLASVFGFHLNNGFAFDTLQSGPMIFRRSEGTLADHPITSGRSESEQIDSVATFTGEGFEAVDDAEPLLVFGPNVVSLMPEVAWEFDDNTKRIPIAGWYQGAVRTFGKGRVAVFGEAAMFTSQRAGPERRPVGMSSPSAPQNQQFVLNVIHWLSGLMDDR